MAVFKRVHGGLAYGDGVLQGAGRTGQAVRLVGSDLFAVNTDPNQPSFGFLLNDYQDREMPGIFCNGGVAETDTFRGTIAPGDRLAVDVDGYLVAAETDEVAVVGIAVAVLGRILKFRSWV